MTDLQINEKEQDNCVIEQIKSSAKGFYASINNETEVIICQSGTKVYRRGHNNTIINEIKLDKTVVIPDDNANQIGNDSEYFYGTTYHFGYSYKTNTLVICKR